MAARRAAVALVVLVLSILTSAAPPASTHALIVSTSVGFFNYRHAANALAMRELLVGRGVRACSRGGNAGHF